MYEITRRPINKRTATIKAVRLYIEEHQPNHIRRGDVHVRLVKVWFPWNLQKAITQAIIKLDRELS